MRIRRLVMLRHGQTDFNAGSRMQGQLDSALTELGRAQAVAAAEVLGKLQPLLIVSSDLHRAYDTAVTLGEQTGLRVRVDERLRETHLGDWQGLTHTRSTRRPRAPGWCGARTRRGRHTAGEQGRRGCPQRVAGRRADRRGTGVGRRGRANRPVVLVAHGGLIAALSAALLKLPIANWPILGGMGNASWVQLSGHPDDSAADLEGLAGIRWRLDVWNASAQVSNDVL